MSNNKHHQGEAVPDYWFTDYDRYLFAQGTHERIYDKMGAHLFEKDGVKGVCFAVWAPNAEAVSVIGDFNDWNETSNQLICNNDNGIWTLFVPGLTEYCVYKYRIKAKNGESYDKADPYGYQMEQRPKTGSVVYNVNKYSWNDDEWIKNREHVQNLDKPISVYEVHLGSWRKKDDEKWGTRYLTYRELVDELLPYVIEMGFSHVELLPFLEHPLDASWGYQVTGFYAPTSRFGTPEDLMYFVDQCHQNGIGVILDWVPGHFPKDGAGLNYFDGTHLYAHEDPRQGEHMDWGTMIFNYDRNEVRSFLISNALFWVDKYHIDGLRVDAVASMLYLDYSREEDEWIPNQYGGNENLAAISFLRKMNEAVHGIFPGTLTIAEESTSWSMVSRPTYVGGLGFSLKWNMGWMHDTLRYMSKDPIHRKFHHHDMTFGICYAFHENFILTLSHDEVVHGKGSMINKMPGDDWQKFANLRAYYGFMYGHPGKKMLFMGDEFGQWQEWNFETSLEWAALSAPNHQGLSTWVKELNRVYKQEPALHENDFDEQGFSWIDVNDGDNSIISFIRFAKQSDDFIVFVSNFTPVPREEHRVGVPQSGSYREIINSDLEAYWGSGIKNNAKIKAEKIPWNDHPYSIAVKIPPLATVAFKLT